MNSMPSPNENAPVPGDVADVVGAGTSPSRASLAQLSKLELIAMAVHYAKALAERSQEVKLLERIVAKQSKGK